MSTLFGLEDIRELTKQLPADIRDASTKDCLIPTVKETGLTSSAQVRRQFEDLLDRSTGRIAVDSLPLLFDLSQKHCTDVLHLENTLMSVDKQFIVPNQERASVEVELLKRSNRAVVDVNEFTASHEISTPSFLKHLDETESGEATQGFDALNLFAGKYLSSQDIQDECISRLTEMMREGQDTATRRVPLGLDNAPFQASLYFAAKILAENDNIDGWLIDRGEDHMTPPAFAPNSYIITVLRTGETHFVNLSKPFANLWGDAASGERAQKSLRTRLEKHEDVCYFLNGYAISMRWLRAIAEQLSAQLAKSGMAKVQWEDLPSHLQSRAIGMLLGRYTVGTAGTNQQALIDIPCMTLSDCLVTDKWQAATLAELDQSAEESAVSQFKNKRTPPAFDITGVFDNLLRRRGLDTDNRGMFKREILTRSFEQRINAVFENKLNSQYDSTRSQFSIQYYDRILSRVELAEEFIKSIPSHPDLQNILQETLETWIKDSLLPQNLKTQSPLMKQAQECNDRALDRKVEALKSEYNGIQDLRTFPGPYRISQQIKNTEARERAKADLVHKQEEYLAKETKPLDGLLQLVVILLARRNPGFAHARGKHIPKLISILHKTGLNGEDEAENRMLEVLEDIKQKVKANSAGPGDLEVMREIEREDRGRFGRGDVP
ncbi:MAG: hypothetical protein M1820_003737 [Bogoriella megaspora]|nr:MAG: hypothetical protein M1820_003737 [Bogoriella megaspora]